MCLYNGANNYLSSHSNSKATRLAQCPRFQVYDPKNPGPGTYEEIGRIAAGKQVCTNFHSTIVKNMATTEPRHQWGGNPRFRTPAPGTYRPPSDFGYLEFKNTLRANFYGGGLPADLKKGSNKGSKRNLSLKNTFYRTIDESAMEARVAKKSGAGNESTRLMHDATQHSTFYSQQNSFESPRDQGATITPMTSKINYTSSEMIQLPGERNESPKDSRLTKTPTHAKGLLPSQITKFKKAKLANSALKDMVVIYADMGQKHLR